MSPTIVGLTAVVWAIPIGFGVAACVLPAARGLEWLALPLVALFAWVWLWWRPATFEVDDQTLCLVFPMRQRRFPRAEIRTVRRLDRHALRNELGFSVRIGAGGLWGGFGWLWTRRRGLVEFYVSRLDDFVLLERDGQRTLLLTPADPAAFVRALGPEAP